MTLREKWAEGPRTYLGIAIAGFPNLFTITGPGSPSVLSNMIVSIEQHVDWIADCIAYLRGHDTRARSRRRPRQQESLGRARQRGGELDALSPMANSWYMGANIPGKPRVFMPYVGGLDRYTDTCDAVAADDYRGFTLTPGENAGAGAVAVVATAPSLLLNTSRRSERVGAMPKLEQAYHSAGPGYLLAAVALLIAVGAAMWLVLWCFTLMIWFGAPFGWAALRHTDEAGDRILPHSTVQARGHPRCVFGSALPLMARDGAISK